MLSLSFGVFACEDDSARTSNASGQNQDGGSENDMNSPDMGIMSASDQGLPTPLRDTGNMGGTQAAPAYVEMNLNRRRALYTRSDHPVIEYTVYDRIGRVIPEYPVRLDVQPRGQAEVGSDERLNFLQEGPGAVRGCATPDICGRVSFFVDDAPATLEIIEPERGSALTGEPVIRVHGRTDVDPRVRVFVNDLPVDVDENGEFRTEFRAEFGMNRVDILADDGVRRPATRSVREVLWAPRVIDADNQTLDLSSIAIIRAHQRSFDSGDAPEPPGDDGIQRIFDLAGTVTALLERSEPYRLISEPQVAQENNFSLRINDAGIGQPDVAILLTDDGMEIFIRFEGMTLETSGEITVEGEVIDLAGTVELTVAGYAAARMIVDDGGRIGVHVDGVGIAVERLSGRFNDSTAQALVDTIGSIVRTALNQVANGLIDDIIRTEIPDFIELGLDDAIAPFREIDISLPASDFLPAINLTVGLSASRPEFFRRDRMELILDGAFQQPDGINAPHPSPGVLDFAEGSTPVWPPSEGLVLALRLSIFNALLDSVWRAGALRIDVSEQVGDVLPQISAMSLDARLPPVLVPTAPGAPYLLELQVGEVDVFVQNPANPEPDHYVMSMRTGVDMAFADGQLATAVDTEPDIRFELVAAGGDVEPLASSLFETILTGQIGPLISEQMGEALTISLDTVVLEGDAFEPLQAEIERIRLRPGFPTPARAQNGWVVVQARVVAEIE